MESIHTLSRALLLLALIVTSGCAKRERWNVVLVTFDTTRADHIECYGHKTAKTPTLNKLAQEGVLFEYTYAPVPITLPSHATMMTGKVPFTHGIRDNGLFVLQENQTTLAEILKEEGYATGAAIGSYPLISKFGLNQGFDFYNETLTSEFEDLYGNRVVAKKDQRAD